MPNYVDNTLHIYGDREVLDRIRDEVSSDSGVLDFNTIIPIPPHSDTFFNDGAITPAVLEKYGKNTAYHWCIDNWGTKWNCLDPTLDPDSEDDRLTYTFYTAWSAAIPIAKAIAAKYSVAVELLYMDEDRGRNCGIIDVSSDGSVILQEHYAKDGEQFIERYFG